jgi:predicted nucleotidyltransferase
MIAKNKHDIFAMIKDNAENIKKFGVIRIGLFGSFVKGMQTDESDIDVLAKFDPEKKSYKNFINLAFLLQDLFHRKVEIVTPQSLSKYIGPKILKETEYIPLACNTKPSNNSGIFKP